MVLIKTFVREQVNTSLASCFTAMFPAIIGLTGGLFPKRIRVSLKTPPGPLSWQKAPGCLSKLVLLYNYID